MTPTADSLIRSALAATLLTSALTCAACSAEPTAPPTPSQTNGATPMGFTLPSDDPTAAAHALRRQMTDEWNTVLPQIDATIIGSGYHITGGSNGDPVWAEVTVLFKRPKDDAGCDALEANVASVLSKRGYVQDQDRHFTVMQRGPYLVTGGCGVDNCAYDLRSAEVTVPIDTTYYELDLPDLHGAPGSPTTGHA